MLVNNIQAKADYVVVLDHEGGKGYLRHRNKVAVFGPISGDSIVSKSTLSLGGSVQTACEAIEKDWAAHGSEIRAAALAEEGKLATAKARPAVTSVPIVSSGKMSVVSSPAGADIGVDGSFVGNTPSDINVADGEHTVSIQKSGFKSWQRKIKVSSGSNVHLEAELQKAENTTADSKKEAVQRPTVAVMEVKKDVAVAKPVAQPAPAPSTPEPSTARGASISTVPQENTGTVSVTSEPNGVAIYVDNSFVGTAPVTLKLKPGKHSMRGFKDGYQNWFQMVSVDAGQDLSLMVAMQKSK